ncbi:hypothetical protein [Maioricimonas sp. JC845]|uniref:restriction system modified-DNA reader domain-containing protein n=1 Tax=Maioricimonas sp. JC845 TaxID=3232138 RepID=UPI0034577283
MQKLRAAVANVAVKINKYRSRGINEQDTKAALIQPILRALGWDVEDPEELAREYKQRRQDRPVDYALQLLRSPCLFIEAKSLGSNLDDHKWANQIANDAMQSGVEWGALTDGDEYRLYNSHAPVPLEEKLFRKFRISDDADAAVRTLALLSKSHLREKRIDVTWNAHFVDRKVRAAVEELFSVDPDPDPSIVRLITKRAGNLTAGNVKASLRRVRIRFDFPVDPSGGEVPESDMSPETTTGERPARRKKSSGKRKTSKSTTLRELIDAGMLPTPLTLFKRYKGHDLEAVLESDGSVRFNGTTYNSCSTAAGHARGIVTGRPMSTNGWEFWQFRDAAGNVRTLADVRQELVRSRDEA